MSTKPEQPRKHYPLWRRLIKIVLWTAMAAVLLVAGTLICAVSMLRPEHLTPLVLRVADKTLDADVSLSRVELSLRPTFPFLSLEADSLCIVSRAMRRLPADVRAGLPPYADTLARVDRFSGGINLVSLAKGEIDLSDIIFERPGLNIVTAADGTANYMIAGSSDEKPDSTSTDMPALRISRFELRRPLPIRYYDATAAGGADSIAVQLHPDAVLASGGVPMYSLSFSGNLHMPMLGAFNLWELPFAFDGSLRWDPAEPYRVRFENFSARAAFIKSLFTADIDFADNLTLRELDLALEPVRLDTLLSCLPDSIRRTMPLLKQLRTDAAVAMNMRLTQPFNTLTDTIPYADVDVTMEPCTVSLGPSRMHDVEARLHASLRGNDMEAATVEIERLHVAGPATALTFSGTISDIGPDPYVDGRVEGYSNLGRLPAQLRNLIPGSLSGRLRADMRLCGRPSMFAREKFHNLRAGGTLHGEELYWLGADTARAAYARRADFRFGTQDRITGNDGHRADSMLRASISIDSLSYLDHDIDVRATGFKLSAGASNKARSTDTTEIVPMGGGLSLTSLRVQSIADSAGIVARDLGGRIMLQRFEGGKRQPLLKLRIGARRLAAGSPDARFLLSEAHINADAHLKPPTERQKRIRHSADSLRRLHPELPLDSVYAMALRLHRRKPGRHQPRVHAETTSSDREIIEWGTSRGLARLLTRWVLEGNITAKRAGLYTPAFPLRNRVRNFNLSFSTDSITLHDVQYKVGRSDFTITGRITNIRRALMSRTGRSPLRVNFDLVSDTIDVNQLAAATFAGAAYTQRRAEGMAHSLGSLDSDTTNLDEMLARGADTIAGPLLVPSNIDAELHMRANNIIYSDLLLHNFRGDALMNNGRLNFHDLHASGDIGSVNLSALYSAPTADDMQFGFGMVLKGFNIERFLRLVPAIDSIMPLMRDISGIIDANIAATVDVDSNMDLRLPTLNAAVRLEGDSLRLLDGETFRTMAKWLMFKDKKHNLIDSMSVELLIDKGMMEIFPFVFNLDRYRLGVQGYNDMALNFNYRVSVLKSPLPFKFGITLKGNPDDFKVRLGRAKFNERTAIQRPAIVDTTRVNLLRQIEGVFRRGVAGSRMRPLQFDVRPEAQTIDLSTDTLSRADSLLLQREGLIPAQ
ncbi:MAG: hypothetical protein J6J20_08755 [Muribaculaceae bacterium]|nr:hypothetical protein [Muribaculaceae bacterium]